MNEGDLQELLSRAESARERIQASRNAANEAELNLVRIILALDAAHSEAKIRREIAAKPEAK